MGNERVRCLSDEHGVRGRVAARVTQCEGDDYNMHVEEEAQ